MTKEEVVQKNKQILSKYLPEKAIDKICQFIFEYDFKLIVKGDRKSKWGDFQAPVNTKYPIITINKTLNKYAFLITLVHEIAHCKTHREYGHKVLAHGEEWKKNFQLLMQYFLDTSVFPIDVLYALRKHMKDPKASANADTELHKVLMNYNEAAEKTSCLLEYLKDGDKFVYEGKIYERIKKRRKNIECIQTDTNKKYIFSPVVEVRLWI